MSIHVTLGTSLATIALVGSAVVATTGTKITQAVPITASPTVKTTGATPARPAAPTTPSPATTATATAPAAISPKLAALPPLDLSDMQLWNWNGKWMASEWGNGFSPLSWKYDHVSQPSRGDTFFTLDAAGSPELQAMNGTPVNTRGLWETDVTLPRLKPGMIVAPLWIYDPTSCDEVDFEFAGRNGLDLTMHASVNGTMQRQTVRLFASQDMSGQRHRFGIKVDEASGFVEMYLDGKRIQRWDRSATPLFVSHPLKPYIEMWAADPNNAGFVSWAGAWQGLAPNESVRMTVHGYGFTAIP